MDIVEIFKILPHRYPFLLVDKIVEIESGKKAVGIKNVTVNEPFFQGHYPGRPIMPGVLVIEALAQVGGIALFTMGEQGSGLPLLVGIDGARFRKTVVPGDQLVLNVDVLKARKASAKVKGTAEVAGETAAEAELLFVLNYVSE